ncbi:hypothetical protein SSX86_022273 [Deinandra increscens subsp. villosa]|uniref:Uncharacterized protein n=1 Tax=Deinandra increscens subsp. villosa TaxID=3103831 RepID=A0AAP0CM62_9ASTR
MCLCPFNIVENIVILPVFSGIDNHLRHGSLQDGTSCINREQKHTEKKLLKKKSFEMPRTVNLFCPSVSKAAQLVARDDQRLDLGYIARTFGLDPATVKLNGHFISRGVDLIASSVTWKSLISFFSSRGLSTGTSGSGALVVDGKLSKSGSKRANNSVNGITSTSDVGYNSVNRKPVLEDSNSSKRAKFKDVDSTSNAFSLKRKQEDASSSLKRLKVDESVSGLESKEQHTCPEALFKTRFPCSFLGKNTKRRREDEMVVPPSCKKCR